MAGVWTKRLRLTSFLFPTVGSLVENRAYFASYPGGTSSLKQTPVSLAAYSSRTVYIYISSKWSGALMSLAGWILFYKLHLAVIRGRNGYMRKICLDILTRTWLKISETSITEQCGVVATAKQLTMDNESMRKVKLLIFIQWL